MKLLRIACLTIVLLALTSVDYKRVEGGYELDVTRGWVGKPLLDYPPEFWRGLGLVKSNMKPKS